jgi:hypothetical protein
MGNRARTPTICGMSLFGPFLLEIRNEAATSTHNRTNDHLDSWTSGLA